jgi:4a-hydroxytetrahydrobiopterin dehydratase
MSGLAQEPCVPCTGDTPRIEGADIVALLDELDGRWRVEDERMLERTIRFDDFRGAMSFANEVGELAERSGHHPELCVTWGRVTIRIWTHAIDGLSRNDFILAARIDEVAG